jgi:hypothetical protein
MQNIPPIPSRFDSLVTFVHASESPADDTISYTVEISGVHTARQRGKLLMDLEDELRILDCRIRVWHIPLGDKNSLRNLRGIKLN